MKRPRIERIHVLVITLSILLSISGLLSYFYARENGKNGPFWDLIENISPEIFVTFFSFAIIYLYVDQFIIKEYKEELKSLKKSFNFNDDFIKLMLKDNQKSKLITMSVMNSNLLAKEYYHHVFKNHYDKLQKLDDGIKLGDENTALSAFVLLWDDLLARQNTIDNKNKGLIVRAVHTNSIEIWKRKSPKYGHNAELLFNRQEQFIAAGGKIYRIFRGSDPKPSKQCRKVMAKMNDIGIKTKYLKVNQRIKHDFLLLYDNFGDEDILVQWNSDSDGQYVSDATIEHKLSHHYLGIWEDLYKRVDKKGKGFNIPRERQFFKPYLK